jgi:hypothetical protein
MLSFRRQAAAAAVKTEARLCVLRRIRQVTIFTVSSHPLPSPRLCVANVQHMESSSTVHACGVDTPPPESSPSLTCASIPFHSHFARATCASCTARSPHARSSCARSRASARTRWPAATCPRCRRRPASWCVCIPRTLPYQLHSTRVTPRSHPSTLSTTHYDPSNASTINNHSVVCRRVSEFGTTRNSDVG